LTYANPDILLITNPIGLDAVVQSIQQDIYLGLPWLQKSFGRAWEFKEIDTTGKVVKYPKCYIGEKEYLNVLPNDHLKAQSFIACKSEETWPAFTDASMNSKERTLSIIFWFNLFEINPDRDMIFTEELKYEVEKVLKQNQWTKNIIAYYDERTDDIFSGYTIDDEKTQYLMYPYLIL
jgi:hypothetical protein